MCTTNNSHSQPKNFILESYIYSIHKFTTTPATFLRISSWFASAISPRLCPILECSSLLERRPFLKCSWSDCQTFHSHGRFISNIIWTVHRRALIFVVDDSPPTYSIHCPKISYFQQHILNVHIKVQFWWMFWTSGFALRAALTM